MAVEMKELKDEYEAKVQELEVVNNALPNMVRGPSGVGQMNHLRLLEEHFKNVFDSIDENHDGLVTRTELLVALRRDKGLAESLELTSHVQQEGETRKRFERVFEEIDADSSDTISFEEFCAYFEASAKLTRKHSHTKQRAVNFVSSSVGTGSDLEFFVGLKQAVSTSTQTPNSSPMKLVPRIESALMEEDVGSMSVPWPQGTDFVGTADKSLREQLGDVFCAIDLNHDGCISRSELLLALRRDKTLADSLELAFHVQQEGETRVKFEDVFRAIDEDSSSTISLDEFCLYFEAIAIQNKMKTAREGRERLSPEPHLNVVAEVAPPRLPLPIAGFGVQKEYGSNEEVLKLLERTKMVTEDAEARAFAAEKTAESLRHSMEVQEENHQVDLVFRDDVLQTTREKASEEILKAERELEVAQEDVARLNHRVSMLDAELRLSKKERGIDEATFKLEMDRLKSDYDAKLASFEDLKQVVKLNDPLAKSVDILQQELTRERTLSAKLKNKLELAVEEAKRASEERDNVAPSSSPYGCDLATANIIDELKKSHAEQIKVLHEKNEQNQLANAQKVRDLLHELEGFRLKDRAFLRGSFSNEEIGPLKEELQTANDAVVRLQAELDKYESSEGNGQFYHHGKSKVYATHIPHAQRHFDENYPDDENNTGDILKRKASPQRMTLSNDFADSSSHNALVERIKHLKSALEESQMNHMNAVTNLAKVESDLEEQRSMLSKTLVENEENLEFQRDENSRALAKAEEDYQADLHEVRSRHDALVREKLLAQNGLRATIDAQETSISGLEEKCASLDNTVKNLQDEKVSLETKLNSVESEANTRVIDMRAQLTTMKLEFDSVQNQYIDKDRELTATSRALEMANDRVLTLETENVELKNKLESQSRSVGSASELVKTLEDTLDNLRSEVNEEREKCLRAEQLCQTAEQGCVELETRITRVEQDLKYAEEAHIHEIAEWKTKVERIQLENEKLLQESTKLHASFSIEKKELNADHESLENRVAHLLSKNSELSAGFSDAKDRIQCLENEKKQMEKKEAYLVQEYEMYKSSKDTEISALNEKEVSLSKSLSASNTRLRGLEQELENSKNEHAELLKIKENRIDALQQLVLEHTENVEITSRFTVQKDVRIGELKEVLEGSQLENDSLKDRVKALQGKCEETSRMCEKVEQEKVHLREQIKILQSELSNARSTFDFALSERDGEAKVLRENHAAVIKDVSRMKDEEYEQLKTSLEEKERAHEVDLQELKLSLCEVRSDLQHEREQKLIILEHFESSRNENNEQTKQRDELLNSMEDTKTKMAEEIKRNVLELKKIEGLLEAEKFKTNALEVALDSTTQKLRAHEAHRQGLEEDLRSSKAVNGNKEEDMAATIEILKTETSNLRLERTRLEEENVRISSQKDDALRVFHEFQARVNVENEKRVEAFNLVERSFEAAEKSLAIEKERNEELTCDLEKYTKSSRELELVVQMLRANEYDSSVEYSTNKERIRNLECEVAKLYSANKQLEAEVEHGQATVDSLNAENALVQEEYEIRLNGARANASAMQERVSILESSNKSAVLEKQLQLSKETYAANVLSLKTNIQSLEAQLVDVMESHKDSATSAAKENELLRATIRDLRLGKERVESDLHASERVLAERERDLSSIRASFMDATSHHANEMAGLELKLQNSVETLTGHTIEAAHNRVVEIEKDLASSKGMHEMTLSELERTKKLHSEAVQHHAKALHKTDAVEQALSHVEHKHEAVVDELNRSKALHAELAREHSETAGKYMDVLARLASLEEEVADKSKKHENALKEVERLSSIHQEEVEKHTETRRRVAEKEQLLQHTKDMHATVLSQLEHETTNLHHSTLGDLKVTQQLHAEKSHQYVEAMNRLKEVERELQVTKEKHAMVTAQLKKSRAEHTDTIEKHGHSKMKLASIEESLREESFKRNQIEADARASAERVVTLVQEIAAFNDAKASMVTTFTQTQRSSEPSSTTTSCPKCDRRGGMTLTRMYNPEPNVVQKVAATMTEANEHQSNTALSSSVENTGLRKRVLVLQQALDEEIRSRVAVESALSGSTMRASALERVIEEMQEANASAVKSVSNACTYTEVYTKTQSTMVAVEVNSKPTMTDLSVSTVGTSTLRNMCTTATGTIDRALASVGVSAEADTESKGTSTDEIPTRTFATVGTSASVSVVAEGTSTQPVGFGTSNVATLTDYLAVTTGTSTEPVEMTIVSSVGTGMAISPVTKQISTNFVHEQPSVVYVNAGTNPIPFIVSLPSPEEHALIGESSPPKLMLTKETTTEYIVEVLDPVQVDASTDPLVSMAALTSLEQHVIDSETKSLEEGRLREMAEERSALLLRESEEIRRELADVQGRLSMTIEKQIDPDELLAMEERVSAAEEALGDEFKQNHKLLVELKAAQARVQELQHEHMAASITGPLTQTTGTSMETVTLSKGTATTPTRLKSSSTATQAPQERIMSEIGTSVVIETVTRSTSTDLVRERSVSIDEYMSKYPTSVSAKFTALATTPPRKSNIGSSADIETFSVGVNTDVSGSQVDGVKSVPVHEGAERHSPVQTNRDLRPDDLSTSFPSDLGFAQTEEFVVKQAEELVKETARLKAAADAAALNLMDAETFGREQDAIRRELQFYEGKVEDDDIIISRDVSSQTLRSERGSATESTEEAIVATRRIREHLKLLSEADREIATAKAAQKKLSTAVQIADKKEDKRPVLPVKKEAAPPPWIPSPAKKKRGVSTGKMREGELQPANDCSEHIHPWDKNTKNYLHEHHAGIASKVKGRNQRKTYQAADRRVHHMNQRENTVLLRPSRSSESNVADNYRVGRAKQRVKRISSPQTSQRSSAFGQWENRGKKEAGKGGDTFVRLRRSGSVEISMDLDSVSNRNYNRSPVIATPKASFVDSGDGVIVNDENMVNKNPLSSDDNIFSGLESVGARVHSLRERLRAQTAFMHTEKSTAKKKKDNGNTRQKKVMKKKKGSHAK